ncbi:MAG: hypothetical protein R3B53_00910 [Candidatus Paceibacterota bacterium]
MFRIGKTLSDKKILLGYLLSGLCLGIGFLVPTLWVVVIFGVASFVWLVTLSDKYKVLAIGGLMAWTSKTLFAISWFWSVYPISVFDLDIGYSGLLVIFMYWSYVGVSIGLAGLFFALICSFLYKNFSKKFFILTLPFFWLLFEITGSYLFTLFSLGEGGTLNGVFSFGYIGYLLAEHPWLLQIANFGGVFTLTLVTVFLGVGLWQILTNDGFTKRVQIIGIVLLVVWISGFLIDPKPIDNSVNKIKVAIVDTNFSGREYSSRSDRAEYHAKQMREALKTALEAEVDYVVMSEDSRYIDARLSPLSAYSIFRFDHADTEAVVIEAGRTPMPGGVVTLRATIYDGQAKTAYGVDKQYLVPQGEYMPKISTAVMNLFGLSETAKDIDSRVLYRPGPLFSQSALPSHVPGVLFCFATADPLGVFKLTRERALPFIAHPVSHAWFNNPYTLWHQFDTMLKVQAVWNNVPIVSAGNKISGALYTENGLKVEPEVFASGESWQVKLVEF